MLDAANRDAWLPEARASGTGAPLVCFPPAGAGAGFFREWSARLPGWHVAPAQPPGREERFGEPAVEDALALAAGAAAAIRTRGWPEVTLLGYSFGALLAFETARALEDAGACRVRRLIVCARAAPQTAAKATVADWPDADLIAYVESLGGLPPEIAAAPEFLALLLPTLRADFRANDLYAAPADRRIAAPIAIVAGDDDPATADGKAEIWRDRTTGRSRAFRAPGGHFFVLEDPAAAFDAIVQASADWEDAS